MFTITTRKGQLLVAAGAIMVAFAGGSPRAVAAEEPLRDNGLNRAAQTAATSTAEETPVRDGPD